MDSSVLNAIMQGGITPLYSSFSQVSEKYPVINADINNIYKFLLENGFEDLPTDVFDSVAELVYKKVTGKYFIMREIYDSANRGQSRDACRAQLAYYIKKNYEAIRNAVMSEYGYDIGKEYIGNKNFVYKLSTVYTVFVSNTKVRI